MDSHKQLLNSCIDASKELLEAAQASRWEELENLIQRRDKQLNQLISVDFSTDQAEDVRRAIAVIKQSDKELMMLVEKNKTAILNNLKKSDKGKKMKAAYGNTQRPY
ncbi:MAG: flagellar protein FliT [Motiliproteus sp.]|nr:flagellar protein FliT [Motiliproteus sp.]MCW9051993.1 flagellar protein FliT [Motiliproteus sp.]